MSLKSLEELVQKYSISNLDLEPVKTYRMQDYPVDIPAEGGSVHVLLGAPSVGKTSLALYMGIREAMSGRHVLLLTWDWASQFLAKRSSQWISKETLCQQKTFLFDSQGSVGSLSSMSRALPSGSLIVIDYLQVFPIDRLPEGFSHGVEGRCSYLSELIQRLARRDGHTFLCLGSMNRESLKVKGEDQGLSSGYGTSRIEYSADSVVIASRADVDPYRGRHTLILRVVKNRWGLTEDTTRFVLVPIEGKEKPVMVSQAGIQYDSGR